MVEKVGTDRRQTDEAFTRLRRVIPGGINSAGRDVAPLLAFDRADGAYLFDVDGNRYLDFHAAYGPVILGHCYPRVTESVTSTIGRIGLTGIGALELEAAVAEKVVEHYPSISKVHFCNSGTEASLHAVRLCRAHTGRKKLIKFQGCNHGWHDYLGMNIITPAGRMGRRDPISAGVLGAAIEETVVLEYNDLHSVEEFLASEGGDTAAIFVEPIAHNVGCLLPKPGFLEGLRELATRYSVVLVFDEIITGFRHHIGGFQTICGVVPDITLLAKSLGNGFPIAAVGGGDDIMAHSKTAGGDVAVVGTYNGHPVGLAAALATIQTLEDEDVHGELFRLGSRFREGLQEIFAASDVVATVAGYGSLVAIYFAEGPFHTYADTLRANEEKYLAFARGMIERGFYILPMNLKRAHMTYSMCNDDIDRALAAAADVVQVVL